MIRTGLERRQAGGTGHLFGVEVEDDVGGGPLRLGQPPVVELAERVLGGCEVRARDREQELGASRVAATARGLHRRGVETTAVAQALELLDLIQATLEEGDEGVGGHG